MDEHGPDVPSEFEILTRNNSLRMPELKRDAERQYLPTLADLIDRLTIVILKQINIPENREAYDKERAAIQHDIALILSGYGVQQLHIEWLSAVAILMLANKTIWDNESLARLGSDKQNDLLRFTHSINGIRNRAKNVIAKAAGERVDLKVDSLASDLPKEFGNWKNII